MKKRNLLQLYYKNWEEKMKKILITFLCAIMVMVFMPTTAFAAENVAKIGDTEYVTLAEAVSKAKNGDTIELLADAEASGIKFEKSLTFNLNDHTIKGTEGSSYLLSPWGVGNNVTFNNGVMEVVNQTPGSMGVQIVGSNCTFNNVEVKVPVPNGINDYSYGVKALVHEENDQVQLTFNNSKITEIEDPSVTETYGAVGIIITGKYSNESIKDNIDNYEKNSILDMNNSTINTTGFAVSGNGATHGTKIAINNCNLTSKESTAIYHPQMGDMTVSGGSLTGATGIEVRAGNVTVTDGTVITATADTTTVDPNGNGTTSLGAAIAVAQHTTKLPIVLNIEGAELTGDSALVANNPQNNAPEDIEKIDINVGDGDFNGLVQTNDGGAIEVTGGTFDNIGDKVTITAADVAQFTENGNTRIVVSLDKINEKIKDAAAGTTVEVIKAGVDSNIIAPDGVIVKNSSENDITVNDETLKTGEEVTVDLPDPDTGDDPKNPPTTDDEKDPVDEQKPVDEEKTDDEVVKTADANDMLPWLALMAVMAIGVVLTAVKSKKREN